MKPLSISAAWNETAAFVKREAGLLFPVALAFLAVPSIAMQYVTPTVTPGQQPELGAWTLLVLPLAYLTIVGVLAVTTLALRPSQTVQDALTHSFRRALPLIGAWLIMAIISFLILLPITAIVAALQLDEQRAVMVTLLAFLAVLTFFWLRFILMSPVAANEPLGAIGMMKHSWQITRGHFNKLIGVIAIATIVFLVVILAATMVFGSIIALILGPPNPGSLSFFLNLIITGVLSAVMSVYFTVMVARIYAQLANGSTNGI